MRRLIILIILAILLCGCEGSSTIRVSGIYTDGHGVQRVSGVDLLDNALISLPAAQVESGVKSGDCISGIGFYSVVVCP